MVRRFAAGLIAIALLGFGLAAAETPSVAYLGARDAYLYQQFRLSEFREVGLEGGPDVVLVANHPASPAEVGDILALVDRGAGLFVVPGPRMSSATLESLLGGGEIRQVSEPVILNASPASASALAREIPWRSAPQVGERTIPTVAAEVHVEGRGEPVLLEIRRGEGRIFVLTPWLASTSPDKPESANYQFQTWAYFPYLLHAIVAAAAGESPVPLSRWPAAPLPTYTERVALAGGFAGLLLITSGAFLAVRRYSQRHPELLDDFVRQNFARKDVAPQEPSGWELIGFHRPLGGFLMFFVLALFVGLPLLIGYSILFRNVVLPFPHATGTWQWVKQFFQFLFTFFDFGTSIALVKYFAELRIHDPRRGMLYIQFYVWWQAISGVAQVALVAGAAVLALPDTDYASLSYVVLGHALIQLPGFLLLFHHVFSAFQRFDLAQLLTLLIPFVPLPLAVVTVRFTRDWGLSHPRFGEALGSVFGMAASDYLGVLSLFALGVILFRSVYGSARVLFLAHFDWQTARTALSFGFRAALSGVAVGLSAMAQTVILAETVDNYAELQGIWGFGWETILMYMAVAGLLFDNARAAVAESYNNGKERLTQYYLTASLRWGFLLAFILWGVLSVGWRWLILDVYGGQWLRTADYLWLFQVIGVMHIPAMLPTPFLQACGHPGLDAATVWVEHAVLIVLLYFLTPEFQLWGMLYARAGALLFARILPAWWLLHRFVSRPRLYLWQCFLVPLATGVTLVLALSALGAVLRQGAAAPTLVLVFAGVFVGAPLGFFISGLLGGWDDRNLAETAQAIELTRFARPLASVLLRAATAGCRLSPLHNRFAIHLADDAARESRELMAERRQAARLLLDSSPETS